MTLCLCGEKRLALLPRADREQFLPVFNRRIVRDQLFHDLARQRQTQSHSSTSWLPRCTESGRLRQCLRASQTAEIREKATRRTYPRSASGRCASPSSGAGAFSAAGGAGGRSYSPGYRGRAGLGGRRRCRVHGKEARVRRGCRGHGLASPLDPHFDIAAFEFELGDVLLD